MPECNSRLAAVVRQQGHTCFKKKVNNKILNVLKTWTAPKLPINGDDVIKYKKINGKEIGIVLSNIERWWVKNCFLPSRKECLKKLESI